MLCKTRKQDIKKKQASELMYLKKWIINHFIYDAHDLWRQISRFYFIKKTKTKTGKLSLRIKKGRFSELFWKNQHCKIPWEVEKVFTIAERLEGPVPNWPVFNVWKGRDGCCCQGRGFGFFLSRFKTKPCAEPRIFSSRRHRVCVTLLHTPPNSLFYSILHTCL